MGECKITLPLSRRKPALQVLTERMKRAGIDKIVIVTGGHEIAVRECALKLDIKPVHNPVYRTGMFSSVLAGVKALPKDTEAFFLLPADIPLIKPQTYKALIETYRNAPGQPEIVYPTFMGKREHPPLIGRMMIERIRDWSGEGGLRGLLEQYDDRSAEIPTADRGTSLDMDTPDDYQILREYFENEVYPDCDEALELMKIARTPARVVEHAVCVAAHAMKICAALSAKDIKLNQHLLRAACLLHDIAKGEHDHERIGAKWLRERGYGRVAKVTATHKNLPQRDKIGEEEILYLTDKLTDGTHITTLEARMIKMEARYAPKTEARSAARLRIRQAARIQRKIEKIIGQPLHNLLIA